MSRDPRIDAYIASRAAFAQPILAWLRDRVHAACPQVEEAIKWNMPAFLLHGRPLANMAGFKAHASFGFWNRATTATGREGEAMGQMGRISSLTDLPDAAAFEALIRRAADQAVDKTSPPRAGRPARPEPEVPEALSAALATDAAARAVFTGFPPSARRDYCEWIGEAKRAATRDRRVAVAIGWLREGKRRNWKYEAC